MSSKYQDITPSDDEHKNRGYNPAAYRAPAIGFLVSLAFLLAIMMLYHPATGGPIVVLFFLFAVFLCFLTGVSGTLQFLLFFFRKPPLSKVRLLYTSVAIAAGVVFLIGLQTLRQLQMIDIILVAIFEAILNFYLLRRF